MDKVVLDASALLALIKEENGSKEVESLLGKVVMSTINISEVMSILLDSDMSQQECIDSIEPFVDHIVPFCKEQSYLAASLKKNTRNAGLSLGDRACIALGIKNKFKIYTADKAWKSIRITNADIYLIR